MTFYEFIKDGVPHTLPSVRYNLIPHKIPDPLGPV
jgi:hypothetical protein